MTIQLIGAGLGRTGTLSLKLAIEQLLGGTCHHMAEVGAHPDEVPVWHAAMLGDPPEWSTFLAGYNAIVDFPGAAVWRELADAFPDAPVLLSTRSSAEAWFESADATILASTKRGPRDEAARPRFEMAIAMFDRLTPDWRDRDAIIAAYEAHNGAVRAAIAEGRLFEYQPGDGWGPLCAALGVPVPDVEFPNTNSTEQFRAAAGLDG
ncbi:MAG: sulfotransferase family protein [Ilumatobacteraceae bacterium]